MTESLNILYQDQYLAVVDKPAGMLVHRSMIDRRETEYVMRILRDQLGQYVYPVHRLDRPTSGVLLFALSSDAARVMSQQFVERTTQKHYIALCRGWLRHAGVLDYPLKEELDKKSDAKANIDKAPQQAVSCYQPIAHVELPIPYGKHQSQRLSWVALQPHTGRKHQLRRHMAHLRHPIVGDTTHGDNKLNRFLAEILGYDRLMLHASKLSCVHPYTSELLSFEAPTPMTWLNPRQFQAELRLSQVQAFIGKHICPRV